MLGAAAQTHLTEMTVWAKYRKVYPFGFGELGFFELFEIEGVKYNVYVSKGRGDDTKFEVYANGHKAHEFIR